MHLINILYSEFADKYYIVHTDDYLQRLSYNRAGIQGPQLPDSS